MLNGMRRFYNAVSPRNVGRSANDPCFGRIVLLAIAVITFVRIVLLILTPLQLYPDEAQYWWWAQEPAFGYFSKPPLIAWLIWLSTALFGNSEWAIRLGSPLLHAATAILVFGIARRLFDARLGFWSALAYLTTPGVSYSSGMMSTDVPLLFFWALALYALTRTLDDSRWRWVLLCGIAFGLGLESKYAMFYFVVCAVAAALGSRRARTVVFGGRGLAILLIGLLLLLPNFLWNAVRQFPTVMHTETNADWNHARYSLVELGSFVGGQFGVFGPALMAALLLGLWKLARAPERTEGSLILAAFCVPPLVIILIQSFVSRANANWAATAYVAATPLAVGVLLDLWRDRALWVSFILNGLAMTVLWTILAWPPFADEIGLGDAFKRLRGWHELGTAVASVASRGHYDVIAVANRSVMAELLYYAQPRTAAMRMWDVGLHDDNQFKMTLRLTRPARRVLLVVEPTEAPAVLRTFRVTKPVMIVSFPIAPRQVRVAELSDGRDYLGPQTHP